MFKVSCLGLFMGASLFAFAQNPLPLGEGLRTADPSAHVWEDGRLYLYTSHDMECHGGCSWHFGDTAATSILKAGRDKCLGFQF